MVRVSHKSIFGQLDLDDVASIRRVIIAMDYTLSNSVVNARSEELETLRGEETAVTRTILSMIRGQQLQGNNLLLRATLRFIEAQDRSEEDVLVAARNLEKLAEANVFNMRVAYRDEYSVAEDLFEEGQASDPHLRGHQTLFDRAPGAFGNQGDSARTGVYLQDFEQRVNPTWFNPASTRTIIPAPPTPGIVLAPGKVPSAQPRTKKRPRAENETKDIPAPKKLSLIVKLKVDWTKMKKVFVKSPDVDPYETESEPESDSPKPKSTPKTQGKRPSMMRVKQGRLPEDEDIPVPVGIDLTRFSRGYRSTPANRPVRFPGQRIIDDGTYDRESAEVGQMDPSKMILSFNVEKEIKSSGQSEPDGKIYYKYRGDVVWDDKISVSALQRWRTQNFGRALGPSQPAREMWLESERDLLLNILQQHLVDVGGRWSKISWKIVCSSYNDQIRGSKQVAGELGAERTYTFNNNPKGKTLTNVSQGQRLPQDRSAPARTALSCQIQLQVFTDKTVLKAIHDAKKADRQAGLNKGKGRASSGKADQEHEAEEEYSSEETDEDIDEEIDEEVDEEADKEQEEQEVQEVQEDLQAQDNNGASARRYAEFLAEEERRITGPRAIAKDKAGKKWIRGG